MSDMTPNHHRRRSIRLPAYDYSGEGAYYITICTQDRLCLFGDIGNGEMVLNELGRIVQQCWNELTGHYTGIELDAFVIMPNHVHAIIIITDDVMVVNPVGAGLKPAPTNGTAGTSAGLKPAPTKTGNTKYHGLPEIIRAFKTFSARKINVMRNAPGKPVWQRNYWEHIIRNGKSYDAIKQYIIENPMHWAQDEENPNQATAK